MYFRNREFKNVFYIIIQSKLRFRNTSVRAHYPNIFVALPSVSKVSTWDFVFCFSNTHIPEHFVLVLCVVISTVSRQHLRTEYLSPFFLDPILLMRNEKVTRT